MKKAYDFDIVFESQVTYRLVLEAFSNPGRIVNIEKCAKKFGGMDVPLCIASTLLDNETTFAVTDNAALAERISTVTMAREAPACDADYIFTDEKTAKEKLIAEVKYGTLCEPHKSATIIIAVNTLLGGPNAVFTGPGVDGSVKVYLDKNMLGAVRNRDEQCFEFPTGVDLLFTDSKGNLLALPRKIAVKEAV